MTMKHDERRDSIRAKRFISVRHRLVKHLKRKVESPWQFSTSENMSLSGLLFVSAAPYHPKDTIELQVTMSGVLDIFNGFGQVVRVSHKKGDNYHVAVRYADLKFKHRRSKIA